MGAECIEISKEFFLKHAAENYLRQLKKLVSTTLLVSGLKHDTQGYGLGNGLGYGLGYGLRYGLGYGLRYRLGYRLGCELGLIYRCRIRGV